MRDAWAPFGGEVLRPRLLYPNPNSLMRTIHIHGILYDVSPLHSLSETTHDWTTRRRTQKHRIHVSRDKRTTLISRRTVAAFTQHPYPPSKNGEEPIRVTPQLSDCHYTLLDYNMTPAIEL